MPVHQTHTMKTWYLESMPETTETMRYTKSLAPSRTVAIRDDPNIIVSPPSPIHLTGKSLQDDKLVGIVKIFDEALRKT